MMKVSNEKSHSPQNPLTTVSPLPSLLYNTTIPVVYIKQKTTKNKQTNNQTKTINHTKNERDRLVLDVGDAYHNISCVTTQR